MKKHLIKLFGLACFVAVLCFISALLALSKDQSLFSLFEKRSFYVPEFDLPFNIGDFSSKYVHSGHSVTWFSFAYLSDDLRGEVKKYSKYSHALDDGHEVTPNSSLPAYEIGRYHKLFPETQDHLRENGKCLRIRVIRSGGAYCFYYNEGWPYLLWTYDE
jgi:hypothetical protein